MQSTLHGNSRQATSLLGGCLGGGGDLLRTHPLLTPPLPLVQGLLRSASPGSSEKSTQTPSKHRVPYNKINSALIKTVYVPKYEVLSTNAGDYHVTLALSLLKDLTSYGCLLALTGKTALRIAEKHLLLLMSPIVTPTIQYTVLQHLG